MGEELEQNAKICDVMENFHFEAHNFENGSPKMLPDSLWSRWYDFYLIILGKFGDKGLQR